MSMTHLSVEPAILYLGTPVVLISSINEDGSPNLAPMSSAFWLQHMQQDFGVGHLTTECVLISFVDNDDREIERGNSLPEAGTGTVLQYGLHRWRHAAKRAADPRAA